MKIGDLLESSYQSLLRTRGRSLLTMLGIIIGIAAVILALSIGESAKLYILDQVSSFGSDQLVIANGPREQSGSITQSVFAQTTLTLDDVKKIAKQDYVKTASGEIFQTDLLQVNGQNMNVNVLGTLPAEVVLGDYHVTNGLFLSDDDVNSHARVAVLGYDIAQNYFGEDNPVGKRIKLGQTGYRVIGVMEKLGTQYFTNLDQLIYIPATTMEDVYNITHLEEIVVAVNISMPEAQDRLTGVMRDTHNIDNPQNDLSKDDFHIVSQEEAIKVVGQITDVLGILLAAIASISLMVGGIGIMNIMFVSVTERVKEIGLRKALGARSKDVLRQFLAEAVILTVSGGVIGIALGTLLSWIGIQIILNYQSGWRFTISWTGVIVGFLVSTLIGLVFGYIPARRAAALHPIEALRANE